MAVTRANLKVWGVSDRTNLITANMTDLPQREATYDLVTTSFALHNIKPAVQREQALTEVVRVLKPGGTLLIVDTGHNCRNYQRTLVQANCRIVHGGQWVVDWSLDGKLHAVGRQKLNQPIMWMLAKR